MVSIWSCYRRQLISLASLWALCVLVALHILFDAGQSRTGYHHHPHEQEYLDRHDYFQDDGNGHGSGDGYGNMRGGRRRSRRGGWGGNANSREYFGFEPSQQEMSSRRRGTRSTGFVEEDGDLFNPEAGPSFIALAGLQNDFSSDFGPDAEAEGSTFHVFQIAKPHTGSTLLNCILQGLLDEPLAKYNHLPWRQPGDGGRFGRWPMGVTQKHVDQLAEEGKKHPFLLHDGRLKLAQESLGVTTVTKTHLVDVDELEEEFGRLFDTIYYVAANRADKAIDERYCEYETVLCVDYDDFAYKPDEATKDDVVAIVQRVKSALVEKFPLLAKVEMDVGQAVARVRMMEEVTKEMAPKPFKQHEPYFGIHGGHRNRAGPGGKKKRKDDDGVYEVEPPNSASRGNNAIAKERKIKDISNSTANATTCLQLPKLGWGNGIYKLLFYSILYRDKNEAFPCIDGPFSSIYENLFQHVKQCTTVQEHSNCIRIPEHSGRSWWKNTSQAFKVKTFVPPRLLEFNASFVMNILQGDALSLGRLQKEVCAVHARFGDFFFRNNTKTAYDRRLCKQDNQTKCFERLASKLVEKCPSPDMPIYLATNHVNFSRYIQTHAHQETIQRTLVVLDEHQNENGKLVHSMDVKVGATNDDTLTALKPMIRDWLVLALAKQSSGLSRSTFISSAQLGFHL